MHIMNKWPSWLWAEFVMDRVCMGPSWLRAEFVMGRDVQLHPTQMTLQIKFGSDRLFAEIFMFESVDRHTHGVQRIVG